MRKGYKKCPWSKNDCRPGAIKFIFLSHFHGQDLVQVTKDSLNVKTSLSLSMLSFITWLHEHSYATNYDDYDELVET